MGRVVVLSEFGDIGRRTLEKELADYDVSFHDDPDLVDDLDPVLDLDYDVSFHDDPGDLETAHAAIVRSKPKVTRELIDSMPELKIIVRAGSGCDSIDIDYARERSVLVENTPGTNAPSVAELTIGQLLALYRRIPEADASTKRREFRKKELRGRTIEGKTVGIYGFGRIGKRVAALFRAFGAQEVRAFDPYVDASTAKTHGVTLVDRLDGLFDGADIVSLHAPLTERTRGNVRYDELQLLHPRGTLICNARAEIVVLDDLLRIMNEREEMTYAADLHHEGDGKGEKAMARFGDRVILTPHIGAQTEEAERATAGQVARQVEAYLERGVPINAVNFTLLPESHTGYGVLAEQLGTLLAEYAGGRPHEMRLIAYGSNRPFAEALLLHGARGMYGRDLSLPDVKRHAKKGGIALIHEGSDVGEDGFGLAYVANNGGLHRVRCRGVVSKEGNLELRTLDDFSGLSFKPFGRAAVFAYDNKPGAAGTIGEMFGAERYNIENLQITPTDGRAIALCTLSRDGFNPDQVRGIVERIGEKLNAHRAIYVDLGPAPDHL